MILISEVINVAQYYFVVFENLLPFALVNLTEYLEQKILEDASILLIQSV